MKKTALIFGATGLVGNLCLEMLVASNLYSKIIVLSRKQITPSLLNVENIIIDFENLEAIKNSIRADDVFCAMGTTIAKAGSQENFTKIDYEIPLQVAQIAKQNGAKILFWFLPLVPIVSQKFFTTAQKESWKMHLKS